METTETTETTVSPGVVIPNVLTAVTTVTAKVNELDVENHTASLVVEYNSVVHVIQLSFWKVYSGELEIRYSAEGLDTIKKFKEFGISIDLEDAKNKITTIFKEKILEKEKLIKEKNIEISKERFQKANKYHSLVEKINALMTEVKSKYPNYIFEAKTQTLESVLQGLINSPYAHTYPMSSLDSFIELKHKNNDSINIISIYYSVPEDRFRLDINHYYKFAKSRGKLTNIDTVISKVREYISASIDRVETNAKVLNKKNSDINLLNNVLNPLNLIALDSNKGYFSVYNKEKYDKEEKKEYYCCKTSLFDVSVKVNDNKTLYIIKGINKYFTEENFVSFVNSINNMEEIYKS